MNIIETCAAENQKNINAERIMRQRLKINEEQRIHSASRDGGEKRLEKKVFKYSVAKKKKKPDIRSGAKVHFRLTVLSFILHVFERQLSSELSHLLVCVGLLVLALDGQLLGFLLDQQPAGC